MLHALKTAFCSVRMKYQKPVASEKLLGALDAVNGKWGWGGGAVGKRACRSIMGHTLGDDDPELYLTG